MSGRARRVPQSSRPPWRDQTIFAYCAELRDRTGLPDPTRWSMVKSWDKCAWSDGISETEYSQRMRNEIERAITAGRNIGPQAAEMLAALPELRNLLASLDTGDAARVQDLIAAIERLSPGMDAFPTSQPPSAQDATSPRLLSQDIASQPPSAEEVEALFHSRFRPIMQQVALNRGDPVPPPAVPPPARPVRRPSSLRTREPGLLHDVPRLTAARVLSKSGVSIRPHSIHRLHFYRLADTRRTNRSSEHSSYSRTRTAA
jgi:hypothetical protein